MFGPRYFGARFFGRRFWGAGAPAGPPGGGGQPGAFWGPRYFGGRYWGARYFPGAGAASPAAYDAFEAIGLRLRSAAPLAADAFGGWHAGASSAPGTRGELTHVSGTERRQTEGIVRTEGVVQVAVFASSRAAAIRGADAARDALDNPHLDFARGWMAAPLVPASVRELPRGPGPGGSSTFGAYFTIMYAVEFRR